MKKFSVNWENSKNENEFRVVLAESPGHAMDLVETEIGAEAMGPCSTRLSDGFITMFEVEEIKT